MRSRSFGQPSGHRLPRVGAVLLAVVLAGCAEIESSSRSDAYQPATLSSPDPNGIGTVSLTEEAAAHVDLATEPVQGRDGTLIVPYAALIYDKVGQTWVYTVVAKQSYRRVKVSVRSIDGQDATLSLGPSPGTLVVTTGSTQVYGSELGMASKR